MRWRYLLRTGGLVAAASFLLLFIHSRTTCAQSAPPPDLTLITFNYGGYNAFADDVDAWLRQHPADVVFLQESQLMTADRLNALRDLYPYQLRQARNWRERNLLLSRYPLHHPEGLAASSPFMRAVIYPGGTPIALYNVSLIPPTGGDLRNPFQLITQYDAGERNRGIEQLLARLEHETLPAVIAGDFNLLSLEPTYTTLTHAADDAAATLCQPQPTFAFVGEPDNPGSVRARLDYVFLSGSGWQPLSITTGDVPGSDHLPLLVTLRRQQP